MRMQRLNYILIFVSFTALLLASCGGGGNEGNYVSSTNAGPDPSANAGPDQSVLVDIVVTLDGSASSDAESDYPLAYQWQLEERVQQQPRSISESVFFDHYDGDHNRHSERKPIMPRPCRCWPLSCR